MSFISYNSFSYLDGLFQEEADVGAYKRRVGRLLITG